MNKDCDLTVGPCACGAWHSLAEIEQIKAMIQMPVGFHRPGKYEIAEPSVIYLKPSWYDPILNWLINRLTE